MSARRRSGVTVFAYRVLSPMRPGRLLPSRLARRLRRRLVGMPAQDVVAAVDALSEAGFEVVVAGGWGIDALLGRQTRRHSDLDLLVPGGRSEAQAAAAVLAELGYRVVDDHAEGGHWVPVFVVVRTDSGRTIELLPMDSRPEAVTGTLAGRSLRCLSAEKQLEYHRGYRPTREDRKDVERLTRHLQTTAAGSRPA